jgi:FixJ family two-component response regulator
MAPMSGRDLLRQVRERRPDALRVLMSGWADPGAIDTSVKDGTANRFLAKPFESAVLLATLRELLDARARALSA